MSSLTDAIRELEAQRHRLDEALRTLKQLERDGGAAPKRSLSPAGRRRIVEAQRRRWQKIRALSEKAR